MVEEFLSSASLRRNNSSEVGPPLITIGITAFNAEKHIERAVVSGAAQTWPAFEIIVVDDRSTDDTVERLKHIAARYPQVRLLLHDRNKGVAAARNRIIDEAKGEFIAFFDDDDVSDLNRLASQYDRIVQYEQTLNDRAPVICHTARRQIALSGTERIEPTMGCAGGTAPHGLAVAARLLWGEPLEDGYGAIATCSQMARADTYRLLGGFDPNFRRSEDMEFCVRLAAVGGHFIGISEPLVVQTLTHGSDKSLEKELFYKLQLIDKHQHLFPSPASYRFSRDWMRIKYMWLTRRRLKFVWHLLIKSILHPFLTFSRIRYALPQLSSNRSLSKLHRN